MFSPQGRGTAVCAAVFKPQETHPRGTRPQVPRPPRAPPSTPLKSPSLIHHPPWSSPSGSSSPCPCPQAAPAAACWPRAAGAAWTPRGPLPLRTARPAPLVALLPPQAPHLLLVPLLLLRWRQARLLRWQMHHPVRRLMLLALPCWQAAPRARLREVGVFQRMEQ